MYRWIKKLHIYSGLLSYVGFTVWGIVGMAVGLLAAIPAVMAYNYFTRRIRVQVSHMNTFEKDYLNIVRRHFLN